MKGDKLRKKASTMLGRVADFLPKLKEANEQLEEQIEKGENLDIEIIDEDGSKEHIEMNIDLGVFDVEAKSPEIGKSDKVLIHDLSPSKDNPTRPKRTTMQMEIHKISNSGGIPVVNSRPAKHHKMVEVPNHTLTAESDITVKSISKTDPKKKNLKVPLIEEM